MANDPLHTDTINGRLMGAPRNDVIEGRPLPPKTQASECEAEEAIIRAYGAHAGAAAIQAGFSVMAAAQTTSNATGEAMNMARVIAASTAWGRSLTVWASLRSALTTSAEKEAMTPAVARALLEKTPSDVLDDFVRWWWRLPPYLIPKSPAVGADPSANPKS